MYTVRVKYGIFWNKIKNIVGDTVYISKSGKEMPVRVFWTKDHVRYEVPMTKIIVWDKDRHYSIHDDIKKEAGE